MDRRPWDPAVALQGHQSRSASSGLSPGLARCWFCRAEPQRGDRAPPAPQEGRSGCLSLSAYLLFARFFSICSFCRRFHSSRSFLAFSRHSCSVTFEAASRAGVRQLPSGRQAGSPPPRPLFPLKHPREGTTAVFGTRRPWGAAGKGPQAPSAPSTGLGSHPAPPGASSAPPSTCGCSRAPGSAGQPWLWPRRRPWGRWTPAGGEQPILSSSSPLGSTGPGSSLPVFSPGAAQGAAPCSAPLLKPPAGRDTQPDAAQPRD